MISFHQDSKNSERKKRLSFFQSIIQLCGCQEVEKGPKITSTSGGWRCPPATSIQSRLFYDAGCIPAHLRYMLQKLSWSKRFYLRFYSFSNIGRSSVIDMSSSRPWSIHHAGPLLGGIFFIFF